MRILVSIALKEEVSDRNLSTSDVDVIFTGIGRHLAYEKVQASLRERQYSHVINLGTAGSFNHQIGEVLFPSLIKRALYTTSEKENPLNLTVSETPGTCVLFTQDSFVSLEKSVEGKVIIPEIYKDVDCFDMEGYAVALAASEHKIPFTAIKVVSDNLDGSISDWHKKLKMLSPILANALYKFINFTLKVSYEP